MPKETIIPAATEASCDLVLYWGPLTGGLEVSLVSAAGLSHAAYPDHDQLDSLISALKKARRWMRKESQLAAVRANRRYLAVR